MSSGTLQRSIGLWGAVSTIVGLVVGAGILILPGQLAATVGPGVFLSFLLASVPAVLACLVWAELGSVFPVSGATYVAVSRLLSPLAGLLPVLPFDNYNELNSLSQSRGAVQLSTAFISPEQAIDCVNRRPLLACSRESKIKRIMHLGTAILVCLSLATSTGTT